jgi:hypothetical protein
MATEWVFYSEGKSSDGTKPRGTLHLLDAERNEFPCGTLTAVHEWSIDTAVAALNESDPPTVDMCPVCKQAKEVDA